MALPLPPAARVPQHEPGAPPAEAERCCVAVPAAGRSVCPVCHSYRRSGFRLCVACERVRRQLGSICPLVVPVSLARIGRSALYHLLCAYKDLRRPARRRAGPRATLAGLLGWFLARHGRCIAVAAGGGWDLVTTVPSTGPHPADHPLAGLVAALDGVGGQHAELLRRGPGHLDHLHARGDGYLADVPVGSRVLLLDDTYTSGARSQSAALALGSAGAVVVAVVPLARLVRPGFHEGARWWECQVRRGWDPQRCCLEAPGAR